MGSERSRPDYRTPPPQFLRDSTLDLAGCTTPETGIRIATRPSYDFLFPLAPLVYYLGATVEIATTPKLITAEGHTRPLPAQPRPYELAIERLLKRFVVCDAMTRTAGPYPGAQAELAAVEDDLPFNPISLYREPIGVRVARYLQADYETLAPVIPQWDLKAHIGARPGQIELLPSLARDLALLTVADQSVPRGATRIEQADDEGKSSERRGQQASPSSVITPAAPPTRTDIQATTPDTAETGTETQGLTEGNQTPSRTATPPRRFKLPAANAIDTVWGRRWRASQRE